jgi:hypothetical protein
MANAMNPTKVMNGSYGQVFHEGQWLMNIKQVEATVEFNKQEIQRAGTRWTGHKVTSIKGTGTMSGYKVTTDFLDKIGAMAESDSAGVFQTELIFKLDDPESYGVLSIRLKGVQFDKVEILKFEVGNIVEEEMPFTFEGYEVLDRVHQP